MSPYMAKKIKKGFDKVSSAVYSPSYVIVL